MAKNSFIVKINFKILQGLIIYNFTLKWPLSFINSLFDAKFRVMYTSDWYGVLGDLNNFEIRSQTTN